MRNSTVNSHRRTNADADHHKAHLIDQGISQDPPQIILDHRKEDREHCHGSPDIDQQFSAGKSTCQGIDRNFGGKGAQKHRAGGAGFRIGIGEPVVQEREAAFDADGKKDQPRGETIKTDIAEFNGTGLVCPDKDTGQQDDARSYLNDEVTHAGA